MSKFLKVFVPVLSIANLFASCQKKPSQLNIILFLCNDSALYNLEKNLSEAQVSCKSPEVFDEMKTQLIRGYDKLLADNHI